MKFSHIILGGWGVGKNCSLFLGQQHLHACVNTVPCEKSGRVAQHQADSHKPLLPSQLINSDAQFSSLRNQSAVTTAGTDVYNAVLITVIYIIGQLLGHRLKEKLLNS